MSISLSFPKILKVHIHFLSVILLFAYSLNANSQPSWKSFASAQRQASKTLITLGDLTVELISATQGEESKPIAGSIGGFIHLDTLSYDQQFETTLIDFARILYPYSNVGEVLDRFRTIANSNAPALLKANAQLALAEGLRQYILILNVPPEAVVSEYQILINNYASSPFHPLLDSYYQYQSQGYARTDEVAMFQIGKTYFYAGLAAQCISAWQSCLVTFPNHPEKSYMTFAIANLDEDPDALGQYVHTYPHDTWTMFAYQIMGSLLLKQGRVSEIESYGLELGQLYSQIDYRKECEIYAPVINIDRFSQAIVWRKNTIRVSPRKDDNTAATRSQNQIVVDAVSQWQPVLNQFGVLIVIDSTLPSTTDIQIRFGASPTPGVGGVASNTATASNGGSWRWASSTIYIDTNRTIQAIRKTTIHELGHGIGLDHSFNRGDIMFFSTALVDSDHVPNRDKETVRKLYSSAWVESIPSFFSRVDYPNQSVLVMARTIKMIPLNQSDSVKIIPTGSNPIDAVPLYDDGTHGDNVPNDGIYTQSMAVPSKYFQHPILSGDAYFPIIVTDTLGNICSAYSRTFVQPMLYFTSPLNDTTISISADTVLRLLATIVFQGYPDSIIYDIVSPSWMTVTQPNRLSAAGSLKSLKEVDTLTFLLEGTPDFASVGDTIVTVTANLMEGTILKTVARNFYIHVSPVTSVNATHNPMAFSLEQNFPNPFNSSTVIKYTLPKDVHVRLSLVNLLGQSVQVLVDDLQSAGYHETRLDTGSLASGIYFYRIEAGEYIKTKKLVLLR